MRSGHSSGLLRYLLRVGIVLMIGLLLYTGLLFVFAPAIIPDWANTLISTLISVFFALLVGLLLFHYQNRESEQIKKADLTALLETQLSEVRKVIQNSRTVVPDEALQTTKTSLPAHATKVALHYTHPLIVEEAVRSGLFNREQTAEMLALARNMRQHNVLVKDVRMRNTLRGHAQYRSESPYAEEFMDDQRLYAQAGRSVQNSEERIINGCTTILKSLEMDGAARPS